MSDTSSADKTSADKASADGWGGSGYMPDLPNVPNDAPARAPISYGDTFRALVSRHWIVTTFFIILGMAGLVSLGIWQIDRLHERRAFNAMVTARYAEAPYNLAAQGLPADIGELQYRRIQADGTFDYAHQIVLSSQPGPNGEPGAQLVTPLVFANGDAVLVARGWVPQDLVGEVNWPTLQDPPDAPVFGLIQESQPLEAGAPASVGFVKEWWRVDIPMIQKQMPYTLLPAFLLQLAEPGRTLDTYPSRFVNFSLDEGNHLSYSVQWFSFALILGFGYIQLVRVQEGKRRRAEEAGAPDAVLPATESAQNPPLA